MEVTALAADVSRLRPTYGAASDFGIAQLPLSKGETRGGAQAVLFIDD